MKKPIITITGDLGSGKSTTARLLGEKLKYQHYSSGDFARKIAADHGFTITEWNKYAEKNPELDRLVDEKNKEMANRNNVIIDARLGFFFIPLSFKVFLSIDTKIAATRIYNSLEKDPARKTELKAENLDHMVSDMNQRLASEVLRYKTLYGIEDHHDPSHYDLVIDTGLAEHTPDVVVEKILNSYRAWLEH